ncbi:putative MATE family efflux protein [Caldalkalibacillus uzonensis]|uniref:Multidrug export protein MepA n=1 Tax=Caldalkalibacillus uzonensis TaxID=353224 RepID=A0ABU0CQ89_9BACI|nr:MATE family efflux transporter [Caldalkalibacillus uzonensis]MDQ0338555.1 putative MATE family efflux protein [Caldalkalibacillus uzonensis]
MKIQSERLGKEPIPKLLASLSIPAMVGMFVMALYNVVDAIFIARSVGTIGVAAVSIAFPVQMIVMAIAGAIGIGGASVISRRLGAGESDEANHVFGNVISIVLIVSGIGVIAALSFIEPLLYAFGASETILPYARDYLGIILYGTVFFAFGFSMNNIIRSEGNAKMAMLTMVISAGLNMLLTPLFIFGFGWGIRGAAGATVLAQAITAVYLVYYFKSGKSSLTFKPAYLRPNLTILKQILAIGSSAFVHQVAGSIMFVVANHMLISHGGDLAVAVFGIVHRIIMFTILPMLGIMQGTAPIVGYNYGAQLYQRVSETIKLAYKVSTLMGLVIFVLVMAFPKLFLLIFTNDTEVLEMGSTALRFMFALCMTIGIQMVTGGVFQALGKARAALILSMARQVLFLIPLLFILPPFWGLTGIWLAFPLADLLAFCLALFYLYRYKNLFFNQDQEPPAGHLQHQGSPADLHKGTVQKPSVPSA